MACRNATPHENKTSNMPTKKTTIETIVNPPETSGQPSIGSRYDLLHGIFIFTTEPHWVRIVLVALILLATIILVLLLRQYALPTLGIGWLSNMSWLKSLLSGKGRAP